MGEPRERLGLAQEPRPGRVRPGGHGVQDLERDRAVEQRVDRAEHHAHAPGAELVAERKVAQARDAGGCPRLADLTVREGCDFARVHASL